MDGHDRHDHHAQVRQNQGNAPPGALRSFD
jgi:hypothetical protein